MNNYHKAATAVLGLAMVASPLLALAEEGVQGEGSATVNATTDVRTGPVRPSADDLRTRVKEQKDLLEKARETRQGSSSPDGMFKLRSEREGSTSPRMRGEDRPDRDRMASGTPRDEVKKDKSEKLVARGISEIDKRIKKLNEAITRIEGMERLSAEVKVSLKADLTKQVADLTALRAKISSGEISTTVKEDVKSITKAYRTYAVVLPKAAITAAADRIMTTVSQVEAMSTKLTARIETASAAGKDVTAAQAANTALALKLADARIQAQAAMTAVAGLVADSGDVNVQASNTTALKAAKVAIDAAQADLKAARKDIETILKTVRGSGDRKPEASTGN